LESLQLVSVVDPLRRMKRSRSRSSSRFGRFNANHWGPRPPNLTVVAVQGDDGDDTQQTAFEDVFGGPFYALEAEAVVADDLDAGTSDNEFSFVADAIVAVDVEPVSILVMVGNDFEDGQTDDAALEADAVVAGFWSTREPQGTTMEPLGATREPLGNH